MGPRGRARGRAAQKTPARTVQTAMEKHMPPLLKKPMECLGKEIKVPGSHWGSACAARDRNKLYVCVILDFTLMYRPDPSEQHYPAFQLNEMGTDGSGGMNSDKFWMRYPLPFLDFYYATFPDELQKPPVIHMEGEGDGHPRDGNAAEGQHVREMMEEELMGKDIAADTEVYKHLTFVSKHTGNSGHTINKFKCNINNCGASVTLYGKSTGAFFKHVRRKAKVDCNAHIEVLKQLNEMSCRQASAICLAACMPRLTLLPYTVYADVCARPLLLSTGASSQR